jgi:tRNA A37 threonylcarbamoyladenosine biosynthesis protein TsaE
LQVLYGEDIFHYDLYNKTLEEFISLGMLEEFEKNRSSRGLYFSKILKYLKKNKKSSVSTIIYGEDIIKYIPSNSVNIKVITKEKFYVKDSICTSYDRNFFGIKSARSGISNIQK